MSNVEEKKASEEPEISVEMDMLKLENKKEADGEDHFARLPDELLLSILSRVDDLKFLCQCSLVSKRFSSTILSIQNVSFTLPGIEHYPKYAENIEELFQQILDPSGEEITQLIRSSPLQMLKFSLFLQKFRELKCIYLEFIYPRSFPSSSFFKWKAKYRSSGPMVESIVSMFATSVRKENEPESDDDQKDQEPPEEFIISCESREDSFFPLNCVREWLLVLCFLIKSQPSLQSVTITDTDKRGKLALRDEHLVEWRNTLLDGGYSGNFDPLAAGMGWVQELHLPLSGYVMEKAYIVHMGLTPDVVMGPEYGDAVTWDYEGEEKLIGEALTEILKKYPTNQRM